MIVYTPDNLKVVHSTSVDFIKRPKTDPIHIVQYDKTIPIIKVNLYLDGVSYILPDAIGVRVRWSKPDKTFVYKDILGCSPDKKSIYFDVDEQMSYYSGIVYPILELKITDGINNYYAGSAPISVIIDENPILDQDVESQSEYFDINPFIDIEQIRDSFVMSLKKCYKEIYKNEDERVYLINIWEDNTKENHLFTKNILYYEDGRLSEISVTDHTTGNILTKTLSYIEENIIGINEIITRLE